MTPKSHQYLVPENYLDPSRYFIVIVDALAAGVSSSPSNSLEQPLERFPEIRIADMMDSQHRILTDVLGIERLHAILGYSMGGRQAFEWAARYPGFANKIIAAVGSPQSSAFDMVSWTTQIKLIELYRQCRCEQAITALIGLGMISQIPDVIAKQVPRNADVETMKKKVTKRGLTPAKSWGQQRQAEAMLNHDIARDHQHKLSEVAKQMSSRLGRIESQSSDDRPAIQTLDWK